MRITFGVPYAGDVAAGVGYVYRRQPDGSILIVSGPSGAGSVIQPSSSFYKAIDAEMKTYEAATSAAADIPVGGGNALTQVFSLFSKAATPEQKQAAGAAVAQAAATYGPGLVDAISTMAANRRSSLSSLQKQLANAMSDYAKTSNASKKIKLAWKIKGLQQQIAQAQAAAAGAQTSLSTGGPPMLPVVPETSAFPAWLPYAAVRVIILVVGLAVMSSRSPTSAGVVAAGAKKNPRRKRSRP